MPTRSTLIAAGVGATALAAGVVGVWYYRRAKAAQRAAALVVADAPEYAPDALLYRIVTVDDWEATLARGDGVYTGTDFDAKDGFIHLSTASTVPATAAFLASRGDELRVLSIDAADLIRAGLVIRYEEAASGLDRGGALMPHVYGGPLPLSSVISASRIQTSPSAPGAPVRVQMPAFATGTGNGFIEKLDLAAGLFDLDNSAGLVASWGPHGSIRAVGGVELEPAQLAAPPALSWRDEGAGEGSALYTVALVDPDAPSPADPKYGPWLHWLVLNVTSPSAIADGTTACEYVPPAPGKGSGLHRYCVVLLRQRAELRWPDRITATSGFAPRRNQDLRQLLDAGCKAVGVACLRAQYDASCDAVHKSVNSGVSST